MTAGPFADLGLSAKTSDLGLTDVNAGGCGCCHGGGGCACGGHGGGHGHGAQGASGVVTELAVSGMTCGHCVSAVTEELAEIYGVSGVDVKLDPNGISTVVVTSDAPLDRAHVAAAIEEAGYALAQKP